MTKTYEELRDEVRRLQDEGKLPVTPTREQRIDWVWGTLACDGRTITREEVADVIDKADAKWGKFG